MFCDPTKCYLCQSWKHDLTNRNVMQTQYTHAGLASGSFSWFSKDIHTGIVCIYYTISAHTHANMCIEETQCGLLSSENVKSCSSSVMTSVWILILLILKDTCVGECVCPFQTDRHIRYTVWWQTVLMCQCLNVKACIWVKHLLLAVKWDQKIQICLKWRAPGRDRVERKAADYDGIKHLSVKL